jgi:hypothetical protein
MNGSGNAIGRHTTYQLLHSLAGPSAPRFCTFYTGRIHHESTHYVGEYRAPELGRLRIPSGEFCAE